MPVIDGLKTTKLLKEKFLKLNSSFSDSLDMGSQDNQKLIRPLICHLTQFDDTFKSFIKDEEKADLFLRKPLPHVELDNLLRLLKLQ